MSVAYFSVGPSELIVSTISLLWLFWLYRCLFPLCSSIMQSIGQFFEENFIFFICYFRWLSCLNYSFYFLLSVWFPPAPSYRPPAKERYLQTYSDPTANFCCWNFTFVGHIPKIISTSDALQHHMNRKVLQYNVTHITRHDINSSNTQLSLSKCLEWIWTLWNYTEWIFLITR